MGLVSNVTLLPDLMREDLRDSGSTRSSTRRCSPVRSAGASPIRAFPRGARPPERRRRRDRVRRRPARRRRRWRARRGDAGGPDAAVPPGGGTRRYPARRGDRSDRGIPAGGAIVGRALAALAWFRRPGRETAAVEREDRDSASGRWPPRSMSQHAPWTDRSRSDRWPRRRGTARTTGTARGP